MILEALVSVWAMPTIVAVVMLSLTLTALAQGSPAPDTSLDIASVPNLRDVGGNTTREGSVVRLGVVYRSGELNPITRDDTNNLDALGLRNDFDLRTAAGRKKRPDDLLPGVKDVWLNVLADSEGSGLAEIGPNMEVSKGSSRTALE